MLKIVADTNILISAVIAEGNEFELLKSAKSKKIELVLSPQILKEFKKVISRPKFGFSQEQISNVFKQIINVSTLVMPSAKLNVIKDDFEDNGVLECAETCKADYIVSGDEHLLNLKKHKNTKIVRTRDILNLL